MLRAATSALIAAVAATVTFGVVAASSGSDSLDTAATATRTAARLATPPPPPPDPTPPPPPPTTSPAQTEGAQVVALLNDERARRGLDPVEIHPLVVEASAVHSADQAANRRMTHTGSDGSNTGDRLDRVGFNWRGWGENVGAGHRTAAIIFDGWMNSDGHRRNMLGNYRYIGVAVANSSDGTRYWTMVLAN